MKWNLKELIGLKIKKVRYTWEEGELYSFFASLKLSNNLIIDIPHYPDEEYTQGDAESIASFEQKDLIIPETRKDICNQEIKNIYFQYYKNEIDDLEPAYIELGNGLVVTELNYHPAPFVGLRFFTKEEFWDKSEANFEFRSVQDTSF